MTFIVLAQSLNLTVLVDEILEHDAVRDGLSIANGGGVITVRYHGEPVFEVRGGEILRFNTGHWVKQLQGWHAAVVPVQVEDVEEVIGRFRQKQKLEYGVASAYTVKSAHSSKNITNEYRDNSPYVCHPYSSW